MTATLVGQVSIGQVVPTTAALLAQLTSEISGKLQGLLSVQAALSVQLPSLTAQFDGLIQTAAQFQAQIAAGLTVSPPGVSLNIAATASLIAELSAQLAAVVALTVTLGTAGVYVITETGDEASYGSEMQAVVSSIAPPGNQVQAVTFLCTEPAVFAALGAVLLTG